MSEALALNRFFDRSNLKVLAGPALIVMILAMMVLPLPPFVLDVLFTFNIALAVMVLMVAMFVRRPLDFTSFPILLLLTTLLRLSLNVATTRLILSRGNEGPGAAGHVVAAFGGFLMGGDIVIGFILFAILLVINFMVRLPLDRLANGTRTGQRAGRTRRCKPRLRIAGDGGPCRRPGMTGINPCLIDFYQIKFVIARQHRENKALKRNDYQLKTRLPINKPVRVGIRMPSTYQIPTKAGETSGQCSP